MRLIVGVLRGRDATHDAPSGGVFWSVFEVALKVKSCASENHFKVFRGYSEAARFLLGGAISSPRCVRFAPPDCD